LPAFAWADQPFPPTPSRLPEPSNDAVLLPPHEFDVPVKTPNHEREPRGEWTLYGGVYLFQPVFSTNPAFIVNSGGGNIRRQVDFSERLYAAPEVWLGYVSERGWGVRGR